MPDRLHCVKLRDGRFDGTSREDLAALFRAYASEARRTALVVHFHGGLVTERSGDAIADRLLPVYRNAGKTAPVTHPVFFIWESGLLETLRNNLAEIARELVFKRLFRHVLGFATAKLAQRGGVRGGVLQVPQASELDAIVADPVRLAGLRPVPEASLLLTPDEREAFRRAVQQDLILQQEVPRLAPALDAAARGAPTGRVRTLLDPEILQTNAVTAGARGVLTPAALAVRGLKALTAVLRRFAAGRDHGVHATVVEELLRNFYVAAAARFVWEQMKKDTADAFGQEPNVHGGTAFLEELLALTAGGVFPRVVLIGHSTGAVYISHFLRHAHASLPKDLRFDVVFLAPAVTFDLLADTLGMCEARIRQFRTFGMQDNVEQGDRLLPVFYPHSLLYFVSGVLEAEADTPIVGMQRYYADRGPYRQQAVDIVRTFVDDRNIAPVWAVTAAGAPAGFRSAAQTHGDFDNDAATLESIQLLLRS